jgi:hypothetical protein
LTILKVTPHKCAVSALLNIENDNVDLMKVLKTENLDLKEIITDLDRASPECYGSGT